MAIPQAVKSFRSRPDALGENIMASDVASWKRSVEKFLDEVTAEHNEAKPRRWSRLATLDLVVAVDWMLQCCVGAGLWQFAPAGVEPPLDCRRRLTLNLDSGPDNICMSSAILNAKRLRVSVIFDCIHKLWRCLWGGVQEANLTAAVFVGSVLCNLDRGPFKAEGNWQKLKEAFTEYRATADSRCELFRWMAPKIMRDRGESPAMAADPQALDDLWQQLPDAAWLRQKGPKVAMTRWATWHKHFEWLFPQYHERLLSLMVLGLSEGWLTKAEQSKFMEALHPMSASAAADQLTAQRSVRESQRSAQKLRDGLPNQIRFTTMAMLDPNLEFDLRLIHFVSEPFRQLYSTWNTTLRSLAATKKHHLSFLAGDNPFFDAIRSALSPYKDLHELQSLGFEVLIEGSAMKSLDADHIMMLEQSAKAKRLWSGIFSQISAFVKGFANYWCGYPNKFACLLSDDPVYREEKWRDCVADWIAWESIQHIPRGVLRQISKRSPFNWTEVSEMFLAAGQPDMSLTDEIVRNAARIFAYHGTELSTEIAFQKVADGTRDARNGRVSNCTVWRRPLRTHIIEGVSLRRDLGRRRPRRRLGEGGHPAQLVHTALQVHVGAFPRHRRQGPAALGDLQRGEVRRLGH